MREFAIEGFEGLKCIFMWSLLYRGSEFLSDFEKNSEWLKKAFERHEKTSDRLRKACEWLWKVSEWFR